MRLVGYVRVSTEEQTTSGLSVEDQRQRIAAWAGIMQHPLITIELDCPISAAVPPEDRKGWQRAVDHLVMRRAEGLVCTALDRAFRSTYDALATARLFDEKDWRLISINDAFDTKTAVGRFAFTVRAAAAELEKSLLRERTVNALSELKRQGRRYTRIPPFGWMLATDPTDKRRQVFAEEPIEQAVLRHVLALATTKHNARTIAASLQESFGDRPRVKKPWDEKSVYAVLAVLRRSGSRTRPARLEDMA